MLKHNYTTGSNCPVAFIAKNKQRIKQYNDTVYLNDGDEFQIELFNPTKEKVLARIDMNAKSIGPGIILRPGERVFLERYVNEARKFKFETYRVNGGNKEAMKAIELNGDVVIKFYKEQQTPNYYNPFNTTLSSTNNPFTFTTSSLTLDSMSSTPITSCYTSNTSQIVGSLRSQSLNDNTLGLVDVDMADYDSDIKTRSMRKSLSKEIETGRVEKGSHSNQEFKADYTNFESYCSWTSEWKLLPESRKPIVSDDIVVYCSTCGRKKRKSENFCPSCGNKL